MPLKKINKNEIDDVINNKNVIYTTGYNTWGGIANGFYITTPNIYKIIANIINLYENWININSKGNAEQFLSFAISRHGSATPGEYARDKSRWEEYFFVGTTAILPG